MARGMRIALPVALMITVINPLIAGQGATLLVRGDEVFGHRVGDVTLEALVYGAAFGLRAAVLILAFSLYSAVVDPDEMLRLFRRFGYRSALTASLATRLVPLLARDASRMSDAARCRPRPPGPRRARAGRAGAARSTARSTSRRRSRCAAMATRAGPRRERTPWSRHDWRVAGVGVR